MRLDNFLIQELLTEQHIEQHATTIAKQLAAKVANMVKKIQTIDDKQKKTAAVEAIKNTVRQALNSRDIHMQTVLKLVSGQFWLALKGTLSSNAGIGREVASVFSEVMKVAPKNAAAAGLGGGAKKAPEGKPVKGAPAEETPEKAAKEKGEKKPVKGEEEKEKKTDHAQHIPSSAPKYVHQVVAGEKKEKDLSPAEKEAYKKYVERAKGKLEKSKEAERKTKEAEERKAEREKIPYGSKEIIKNGQNKTLRATDLKKEPAFTDKHPIEKDEWFDEAKKYEGKDLLNYPQFKIDPKIKTSVPQKYMTTLERMINTRRFDETQPPISFFAGEGQGGAGTIRSQAGELLTLVGTTMNDKDFDTFITSLEKHIKDRKFGDAGQIVTLDWLKAARECRHSIRRYVEKNYPGGEIEASAWDVQEDVEAMGLDDYKKNKGVSTDAYFRIKTKDKKNMLVEVSLKKDTTVNFLNSGATKFKEWDKNIPKDIDIAVYAENQNNALKGFVEHNQTKINNILKKAPKELSDLMKKKKLTIDDVLSPAGSGRDKRKIMLAMVKAAAEKGDADAKRTLEKIKKSSADFGAKAIKSITTNKKLKEGMINEIRSEFPLKDVMSDAEIMAIDGLNLDKAVAKEIFKTNDWNKIQENLKVVGDPPYLAYEVETTKEIVPIAEVMVREDGVGYGGQFKFEMKLHRGFAKKLDEGSETVYGASLRKQDKAKKEKEKEAKKKAKEAEKQAAKAAKKKTPKRSVKENYYRVYLKEDSFLEKYLE